MPELNYSVDNIVLTSIGYNLLKARALQSLKTKISFFQLTDTNQWNPTNSDTGLPGNIVHTSSDIWFNPYSENEVIFRAIVDSSKGDFLIGSIGFYADDGTLLFIAKFPYIHHKMKSTISNPGGRWTCQVRLLQENINDTWDFSNLNLRYAITPQYAQVQEAPEAPYDSFYTEISIDETFYPSNREAFIAISGNTSRDWYVSPTQTSEANAIVYQAYSLDGGDDGDHHSFIG